MPETAVAQIILEQLGGNRFLIMTGCKYPLADGNTLRLHLSKNKSKANRLEITLCDDDTYTMRFYYYRLPSVRFNAQKGTFTEKSEKLEEIELFEGVYWNMLQDIFESVTGLYTTLFPRRNV